MISNVTTGKSTRDGSMLSVCAVTKRVLQLALYGSLIFTAAAFAESQTYKGLMLPSTLEVPVPIGITIERLGDKLKGRLTSSPPLPGEGVFLANLKNIYQCDFKANIGGGRILTFDGYCFTKTIEGKYTLRFPDGTLRDGDLQLKRQEAAKRAPEKASSEFTTQPLFTATACLSANSACLAACPHGDYNAEFICSNRCRQKFVACKAKVNSATATTP
jgi:hypothetical protein